MDVRPEWLILVLEVGVMCSFKCRAGASRVLLLTDKTFAFQACFLFYSNLFLLRRLRFFRRCTGRSVVDSKVKKNCSSQSPEFATTHVLGPRYVTAQVISTGTRPLDLSYTWSLRLVTMRKINKAGSCYVREREPARASNDVARWRCARKKKRRVWFGVEVERVAGGQR